MGEGLPGPHGRANFHHCGIKIVALRPPKSPKIAIFGIHLAPRKKGSIEKLEYRCTRNLFCFENYTASWRFRYHKLRIRSSKAWHKKNKLEINMHHLRGNAIPAGSLSEHEKSCVTDQRESMRNNYWETSHLSIQLTHIFPRKTTLLLCVFSADVGKSM